MTSTASSGLASPVASPDAIRVGILDRFASSFSEDHNDWGFVPVLNYRDAFETVYSDDRHFAPFIVSDGDMPDDISVRLKKHGKYNLEYVEEKGHKVRLSLVVLDIDTPLDLTALPPEWGWYKTKNGARLFAELSRPLEPHHYEAQVQHLFAEFPQADPRCRDWTRLYRLPNVTRCDEKTDYVPLKLRSEIHYPVGKLTVCPEPMRQIIPYLPPASFEEDVVYEGHTADDRIRLALDWVRDEAPEAIDGQQGDLVTFRVAQQVLRGYYLTPQQAYDVMVFWNATKAKPPWTNDRIKYKIEQALTEGHVKWGIVYWNPKWRDGDTEPRKDETDSSSNVVPIDKPKKEKKSRGKLIFPRLSDKGAPISCIENTEALLTHYGVVPRYNLMTHEDELIIPDFDGAADKRANYGLATVKEWCRQRRLDLEPLNDHLTILFTKNAYHPVADWINSKEWDGRDRIDELLGTLEYRDKSEDYAQRMKRVFIAWASTAARAACIPATAKEGVATQLVLVLQGHQGLYKTRWCMSLVPSGSGWAREGIILKPESRDSVKQATSIWLGELGELDATFKKSDISVLKSFITNRTDTYRSPYARLDETVARRTVYLATVNEDGFLHDDTGSRRFATMALIGCKPDHDVDMQQFWAQMWRMVQENEGVRFLSKPDEKALIEANKVHEAIDPMSDWLMQNWEVDPEEKTWHKLQEILKGIDSERSWNAGDGRAIGRALRNKMGATTRVRDGYTEFAVRRVGGSVFQIGKATSGLGIEKENEKKKG